MSTSKTKYFKSGSFLILLIMNVIRAIGKTCPTPCICKWKNGKLIVECIQKGLISIPKDVNIETRVFDFSGNNIQTLDQEIFVRSGLVNLQRLSLKKCNIGLINDLSFKGLTNLIELDLSHNLLTSIPTSIFNYTLVLRELILCNNPIQKIPSNAFQRIYGLVKLDLSNCEIQSISPDAFEGIELLQFLQLNGNALSSLVPGTIDILNKLHTIELFNNPWYCDCHMSSVMGFFLKNNIAYTESPKCLGGPERIINRSFAELKMEDFACKPEILPVTRYIQSNIGNNITIHCRANAAPPVHIKWFFNGKQLRNDSIIALSRSVQIFENGFQEKESLLILTYIQMISTHEIYCVAENRAGNFELNFKVNVLNKSRLKFGMDIEGSYLNIMAAALILLMFLIITIICILLGTFKNKLILPRKIDQQQPIVNNKNSEYVEGPSTSVITAESNVTDNKEMKQPLNIYTPVEKFPCNRFTTRLASPYSINESISSNTSSFLPSASELLSVKGGNSITTESTRIITPSLENVKIIATQNDSIIHLPQNYVNYPSDYGLPIENKNQISEYRRNETNWTAKLETFQQKDMMSLIQPSAFLKRVLDNNSSCSDSILQDRFSTDV